jgi:hypothetical protein
MVKLATADLSVDQQLKLLDKWYDAKDENAEVEFEDWFCEQFNCSITYHPDNTRYKAFVFHTERDLTWFLLNL